MHLKVRIDNERASDLYERAGYLWLGDLENYYEDGASARRYVKRLTRTPEPFL
jgi:ribosomal protein S18 acetylase RimI-like enzyme